MGLLQLCGSFIRNWASSLSFGNGIFIHGISVESLDWEFFWVILDDSTLWDITSLLAWSSCKRWRVIWADLSSDTMWWRSPDFEFSINNCNDKWENVFMNMKRNWDTFQTIFHCVYETLIYKRLFTLIYILIKTKMDNKESYVVFWDGLLISACR